MADKCRGIAGSATMRSDTNVRFFVSRDACHHHVYDLAPTREELQARRETVQQVVERTERAWR